MFLSLYSRAKADEEEYPSDEQLEYYLEVARPKRQAESEEY